MCSRVWRASAADADGRGVLLILHITGLTHELAAPSRSGGRSVPLATHSWIRHHRWVTALRHSHRDTAIKGSDYVPPDDPELTLQDPRRLPWRG